MIQIFDYNLYIYQKNSPCHFKDCATFNGFRDYALCTLAHKRASLETRYFIYDMHLFKKNMFRHVYFNIGIIYIQWKAYQFFATPIYITNLFSNLQSYANNNYHDKNDFNVRYIWDHIKKRADQNSSFIHGVVQSL